MNDVVLNKYNCLLDDLQRSVRYYNRRRGFLGAILKLQKFCALLCFVATVGLVMGSSDGNWSPWVAVIPVALVSVLTGLSIVLELEEKMKKYVDLEQDFIELERQLESRRNNKTKELITMIRDRRLHIQFREPPVLLVLNALCHNELVRAKGYPADSEVHVSFLQRLFANWFDWRGQHLYRYCDS